MSGKEILDLVDRPITCYAFNKDRTRVALSANDNNVLIYKKQAGKWIVEATLSEHLQTVTGIDWAPNTDRIVTCGADRNGYVWQETKGTWQPLLVILRINRAATSVKWSPNEDKFAVASGARIISVCYFEKENDWWVSKHIKKPIRSTVLSLDWHPNNILLVAGSSDFKTRVFSAYIKEIEPKPESTNWGKKMPFGAVMGEYSNGSGSGWVHDVKFSPSGNKIAWVGHDSSISVVQGGEGAVIASHRGTNLPFLSCVWLSESTLVAGGHDFVPMVYTHDGNDKVTFIAKLDQSVKKGDEEETMSAMDKFRSMDKRATGKKAEKAETTHENAVKQLSVHDGARDGVTKISSGGLDGKIVLWDIKSLEKSIADLKIV